MSKKREELIRTASALFAQKGYHGTSMAHIIAAAHIPKDLYTITFLVEKKNWPLPLSNKQHAILSMI